MTSKNYVESNKKKNAEKKVAQNNLTNVLLMKCETEADLKEVKALHAHCKTMKQNRFVVPALKRVISHHIMW